MISYTLAVELLLMRIKKILFSFKPEYLAGLKPMGMSMPRSLRAGYR